MTLPLMIKQHLIYTQNYIRDGKIKVKRDIIIYIKRIYIFNKIFKRLRNK
jgi:hypothetical protein